MVPFIDLHTHGVANTPFDWENDYIIVKNITQNQWNTEGGYSLPYRFSTGLHPWYITVENAEEDLKKLAQLIENDNFIFVGECGLDRLKGVPLDFQIAIFEQQILLAEAHQKPLVIHCVRAYNELIFLKKKLNPKVPLIVHGFNQNINILNLLLENDIHISIGSAVLLTASNAQKAVKKIPLSHLFLETDDSPHNIRTIYVATSEILGLPISHLKKAIFDNFERILKK